jgi:hypothetical protein
MVQMFLKKPVVHTSMSQHTRLISLAYTAGTGPFTAAENGWEIY